MPRRKMPRRHGWVKPLINISCYYAAGDYPLLININFENGVVRRYRDDELHQPAPGNYLKSDAGNVVGYKFNPGREKNRIRCCEQRTR